MDFEGSRLQLFAAVVHVALMLVSGMVKNLSHLLAKFDWQVAPKDVAH